MTDNNNNYNIDDCLIEEEAIDILSEIKENSNTNRTNITKMYTADSITTTPTSFSSFTTTTAKNIKTRLQILEKDAKHKIENTVIMEKDIKDIQNAIIIEQDIKDIKNAVNVEKDIKNEIESKVLEEVFKAHQEVIIVYICM